MLAIGCFWFIRRNRVELFLVVIHTAKDWGRNKVDLIAQDLRSPVLFKIRQGTSTVAYWLSVAVDATQKTDVKTSNLVHFIKFTILSI